MAKRIVAKTGVFTDKQTNQEKGEYTKLGVILSNDNGEYMLLDPTVSLAGVLLKQNALARKTGKEERGMLMVSIFEDDNQAPQQNSYNAPQQQAAPNQGGYQQQAAPQPQGGYQAPQNSEQNMAGSYQQAPKVNPQEPTIDFDDDLPF